VSVEVTADNRAGFLNADATSSTRVAAPSGFPDGAVVEAFDLCSARRNVARHRLLECASMLSVHRLV